MMIVNNIAIGSDHAGFELKEILKEYLINKGIKINDFGPDSDARADYADYAHPVASFVENNNDYLGILICGSGNGINMTANKHQAIRSALCWNAEIAELARLHNDANILVLPARFITKEEAIKCVEIFFNTQFEGGRHTDRVNKIACK
jgi:ribose 5-phosphate isomerase B